MIRQHLAGLSKKETGDYIQAQLRAAGGPEDIFSPDAIAAIFDWSGGRPRRINKIGVQATIKGGIKELRHIDAAFVRLVIKDIDQE